MVEQNDRATWVGPACMQNGASSKSATFHVNVTGEFTMSATVDWLAVNVDTESSDEVF